MNGKFDHELIMTESEYERTGRQVRVPEDELISIVLDRIDTYLELHPRERRNYPDPRSEPVVARIASGKTIEIPQQIVDKALEIHRACGPTTGTVERMESVDGKVGSHTNMSGAHTRLAKRERYAESDPFILDKDLRGQNLVGFDGEVAGDATFNDYPERYREFNQRMNKHIASSRMASDLNDRADPYNSYSHRRGDAYDAHRKASVGSFNFGQKSLAHRAGPGNGEPDYMDKVNGMQSDISPEGDSALVYASLDEDADYKSNGEEHMPAMGPAINMDDYDAEPDYNCVSCGHNDGYRSNYPYHPPGHEHERVNGGYGNIDHRYYDDDELYAPRGGHREMEEQDFDVDSEGYYEDDEDVYNDDDGENKDNDLTEGFGNSSGSYNTALYLLLIVLLVILFINYRQQNGEQQVQQVQQF